MIPAHEKRKERKQEGRRKEEGNGEKKAQIAITLKENIKHCMNNSRLLPKELLLKKRQLCSCRSLEIFDRLVK